MSDEALVEELPERCPICDIGADNTTTHNRLSPTCEKHGIDPDEERKAEKPASVFEQVFEKAKATPALKKAPCVDCQAEVDVEPLCVAAAYAFNAELKRRGKEPLTHREIVRCDECGKAWREQQAAASQKRLEKARALFSEMRAMVLDPPDEEVTEAWHKDLPSWFRDEHGHSLHAYLVKLDSAREKQAAKAAKSSR